jgi:flagellin
VNLVSDGSAISVAGFTQAKTGITTALTATAGTAADTTITRRSLVTLSSTNSAGINVSGSTAAALTAAGLSEGSATVTTTAGTGVSSLNLATAAGSQSALTTLDTAINTITNSRAAMGAYQNRLTASISNLETTSMNLSASRSRILDTDYAKETTNLAKSQIIQQAATAMLAQANQSGQSVLALLK